jgi:hypothetical protein
VEPPSSVVQGKAARRCYAATPSLLPIPIPGARVLVEGILPHDDPLEGMQQWNVFYRVDGSTGYQVIHQGPNSMRAILPGVHTGRNCVMLGDVARCRSRARMARSCPRS